MTVTFLLIGAALGLSPPIRPGRQRLAAMVGSRLPDGHDSNRAVAFGSRSALRWLVISASVGVVAIIAVVAGVLPAALVTGSAAAASVGWRQLATERQAATEQTRLAEVVSALAAEHAAGAPLAAALQTVGAGAGPWQPALMRAGGLAAAGDEPAFALTAEPRLAHLAVALGLADRTGTALVDVLARVRADVLAEQASRRAVAEAVAGPRSSALLLAALPVIGLGMGAALGAHPLHVLTRTPAGLAALTAGVVLELAGLLWTLWLTR